MMYDYLDKEKNLSDLNSYMYAKTLSMFDYTGLPESLPAIEIEKLLQRTGYGFVSEVNGELYILKGNFNGELDAYGNPLSFRVDNIFLKLNKELDLKNDGVLMKNDDMLTGLNPLINRINSLLIENEITLYLDNYNARIQTLISAGDDATKESAEDFLLKIKNGSMGVIGETQIFDGVKAHNAKQGSQNTVTQLIELNQYLKANLYNELGLNANFNMKRERLNTSEVEMNTDSLFPFIDNMLKNRKESVAKINEKYGLEIGVEFGSIWDKTSEILEGIENDEPETEANEELETVVELDKVEDEETETEVNSVENTGSENDAVETETVVINLNTENVDIINVDPDGIEGNEEDEQSTDDTENV